MDRMQMLEDLLSEGLDLCVRARKIDDGLKEKAMRDLFPEAAAMYPEFWHRSATPYVWVQEQYDTDLAEWEARARKFLLAPHPPQERRSHDHA